ncbi:MAG: hypothetical protein ACK5JR_08440 [Tropicimonas sp.]|uniref:hypothetical protein n=1 Tax=Tropicimonas sp. TaxID=2067044 RepID=UPI003A888E22
MSVLYRTNFGAVYSAWAYNNYYGTGGKVRPWPTDRPAGNGGGELSIVDIINEDFVGGPYIVGSGDSGDDNPDLDYLSQLPGSVPVLSSVGVANAMLISGDISFARYEALIAQIGVVAPSEFVSGDNPMVYLPGMKVIIDGVEVEFRANLGVIVNGEPLGPGGRFSIHPQNGLEIIESNSCFGPEVPIDMWPLDPDLKPGPNGIYDQDEVRAKIWKKPIELIRVGDIVVSFDENDNLVPGPVTRTFENSAKILLKFHGTRVTPGHVYYRPDSKGVQIRNAHRCSARRWHDQTPGRQADPRRHQCSREQPA